MQLNFVKATEQKLSRKAFIVLKKVRKRFDLDLVNLVRKSIISAKGKIRKKFLLD